MNNSINVEVGGPSEPAVVVFNQGFDVKAALRSKPFTGR